MEKVLASVAFTKGRALKQSSRQELLRWRPAERMVVAAVCYRRQANGEIEFLLVRTRAGRWTFPKGGVDGDPTAAIGAAREAHEEAGVRGQVEPLAFTRYLHYKNGSDAHTVTAHLCRVLHLETPRELFRTPRWFSAETAKRRLREERPSLYAEELERVVDQAVRCVEAGTPQAGLSRLN
jgi:8-oxo-dGTP pyrophosphatase MutT (NUDIX family)